MAIVEMKRLDLVAMKRDRKKLVKALQKLGCVEVSPLKDEEKPNPQQQDARLALMEDRLSRLTWAIAKLGAYNHQKLPFMGNKPEVDEETVNRIQSSEAQLMGVLDEAERLEKLSGEYKGQLLRLKAATEQLLPWTGLDIPIASIASDRQVIQLVGTANKAALASLVDAWQTLPVHITLVSEVRDTAYFWLAAHVSARDTVMQGLKDANYAPYPFGEIKGTVKSQIDLLENQQQEVVTKQGQLAEQWQQLSQSLTDIKVFFDLTQIERDRLQAESRMIATESAFVMRGWVPANVSEAVEKTLHQIADCCVEVYSPAEDDEPPVQFKNSTFASPFETIVTGFALPAHKSVDPTAVMAPFYACLFGMMLSDAGYGLLTAIAIPLLILIKKPAKQNQKLLWVLFYGGIATVIWGAVYNTWFGFNPSFMPMILDPVGNAMPVMIVCMAVGVIHLYAGLGVAAYMNIKRGKPLHAVYDQLSWILVVTGLIMLVLGGTAGEIGKWMAIAGVALILVFAGREKKNPIKRLTSGLGALYGATSWISDILSYMRLFGMGLATGVIGMVINQLVGMVFSAGIIGIIIGSVLFVGAHCFNLGINALGAYVHACRLQYIEFFGKFYEEGGVAFKPLDLRTRYVSVKHI